MPYDANRALKLLRLASGLADAEFREGQEDAIRHVVDGRGRLLVVQRTGWGKSFVYFIAIKLLREQGAGPALLISPLLSLMRNQIAAAERMGVRAKTINSENDSNWLLIEQQFRRNEIDILLISPERLANERFEREVLAPVAGRLSFLVVDEAHCISDWGHDFRPHYRLLGRIIRGLPPNLRFLATTATANDRVMADLAAVLAPGLEIMRGDLNRPSLSLQTMRLPDPADRLAWIADALPALPGSGIIYALTVRDAYRIAEWLQSRGIDAEAYTGQTGDDRVRLEQALLHNQVKALVATTALGMGFDKPDLSFVIHYQAPGSVVAYYQQVGRAGRALNKAYGVLLSGHEELDITNYFISSAFPSPQEVQDVLRALEAAPDGLSTPELLIVVNISKERLQKTTELLALESPAPLVKQGKRWQLTSTSLSETFWERIARLTDVRRFEQRQMQEYIDLPTGAHMRFLIEALNGDDREIDVPFSQLLPTTTNPSLVQKAGAFLRRTSFPIEARKKWPEEGLPHYKAAGKISNEARAQTGRALSVWGDAGVGEAVRVGKYRDGRFSDQLVIECVRLLRDWSPQPAPAWVTCIPSFRHPDLVPDFARRLADALGLPFLASLSKTDERPEQKTMANSARQARNLDGSLKIIGEPLLKGPVLLVDDMVDSKWTFTVATWLLRTHGSGEVYPLALAQTGHDQ